MTDGLPDQNQTKTCTKCEETKPVTEFYVLRPRKYGGHSYRSSCKQCDSKGAMAWTEKNRDKVNARRREQYHNSERAQRAKSAREEALRQKRLEMARWPFAERTCNKCGGKLVAAAGDVWKSWGWWVFERDGMYKPNLSGYSPDGYELHIGVPGLPGPPNITGTSPCFPHDIARDDLPFPTTITAAP